MSTSIPRTVLHLQSNRTHVDGFVLIIACYVFGSINCFVLISAAYDTKLLCVLLSSIVCVCVCVQYSYPDSLDLLREGLQGYRTRLGDKHPYVADSLCAISHVLGAMGKVTAAHKVLTQATFIYDCALKANNTQTSAQTTSTNNQLASSKQTIVQTNSDFMSKTRGFGLLQMALGANKHLAGKYKDSFQHYSSALTVFTRRAKCLRVEAEMNVAHSLLGLANSLRCLCAYNKSKGLLGKAGVMIVKIFGESHVCVSECLCVLGMLQSDMGNHEEAYGLFVKAHTLRAAFRQTLPPSLRELYAVQASNQQSQSQQHQYANTSTQGSPVDPQREEPASARGVHVSAHSLHPSVVDFLCVYAHNFARVGYFEDGLEPLRVAHAMSIKMFNKRSLAVAKSLFVRAKGMCLCAFAVCVCMYVCAYVCVCVFLYQPTILIACLCVCAVISDLGHPADADVMFQASLVMLQEVTNDILNRGVYLTSCVCVCVCVCICVCMFMCLIVVVYIRCLETPTTACT
jgi:hypothetical protein